MKIRPIKVSSASDVKAASKTMSDVLSFHISLANELNRVIEDINKIMPQLNNTKNVEMSKRIDELSKSVKSLDFTYNDSDIKSRVLKLEKSFSNFKEYDDTEVKKLISKLSVKIGNIKPVYDDSSLKKELEDANENICKLTEELKSIKFTSASNQREIRSNRQESGLALDRVEQAVIRLEKK